MPPPENPRHCDVDWAAVEKTIGLTYPATFKEFVGVYGGSIWCDHFGPFYAAGPLQNLKKFKRTVADRLKWLEGNMYVFDTGRRKIDLPLYPSAGGLFPFAHDFSGSLYCWQTSSMDPGEWPIVCWFQSSIVVLNDMTIGKMLWDWLDGAPRMVDLWGDIRELPPERIRLA